MITFLLILQKTFGEFLWEVLLFPFWWYTYGLVNRFFWLGEQVVAEVKSLALGLWIKNLFVPMYGQYDRAGRIISFFMRLVQIMYRLVILLLWLVFLVIIFILWVVVPIIIIYGLWKGTFLFFNNDKLIEALRILFVL